MGGVSRRNLRLIATFEAAKGAAAVLVAFGVLAHVSSGAEADAEKILRHFHLNSAHRYPGLFIELMERLGQVPLWLLVSAAGAYCTVRLAEAWGLWWDRRWASWVGALSGAIYLPLEIYDMLRLFTWVTFAIFAINLLIVGVLTFNLWRGQKQNALGPSGL
ncbi:MAG: DUF2127 domain-containing protein [Verrucomicrobiales bacterium]